MIVRISKGIYPAGLHAEVTTRMNAASQRLIPAIRKLPGCLGFYVTTEENSSTMVNVGIWETLERAEAMSALAEMTALAQAFIALGVEFERPIINYPVLRKVP
ncbi:antibiotic biosynthesis monooxygenase [Lysobacter capsici]|uniref:antibiotic biosynthesis monooxygenase n=1 Tax=Lysobacter capsici TaxID=435897 RepID=UPI001C002772|nr:antibiotic biosynthesis monooxygenase [Lysobacter capsici]QWF16987.1 antibiotic biosynthesis monooxygenase [Lysobacter capsici]